MKILQQHVVPGQIPSQRLSDYAVGIFPAYLPSRKSVKKAIRRGAILIDGRTGNTGDWVLTGQTLELLEQQDQVPGKIFHLRCRVLWEDEDLAVLQKPAGILTSGNEFRTFFNALPFNLRPSPKPGAFAKPRPVHRLDRATSGLILVAKTSSTLLELGNSFARRQVHKTYQAVVIGNPPAQGEIRVPIDGKEAITGYTVLRTNLSLRNGSLSLLQLTPQTGRTHQLRIHLSGHGFPILGDPLYGKEGLILRGKGLFLSATGLSFAHPVTGQSIRVEAEPPPKFVRFMENEAKRWQKYRSKTGPNS